MRILQANSVSMCSKNNPFDIMPGANRFLGGCLSLKIFLRIGLH